MGGMKTSATEKFIAKWKTQTIVTSILFGLGALLGGGMILFVTFWFSYAIIWFGWLGVSAGCELIFNHRPQLGHVGRLIGSGIFLALLFTQYFRTSPWHWGEYPRRNYVHAPGIHARSGNFAIIWLLIYPGASTNMIADLLLTGPRLIVGASSLFAKILRLRKVEVSSCARILSTIVERDRAVTYDELNDAGWEPWLQPLKEIEGIHFLENGISVSDELKLELRK
jgi:hypothetical protein